MVNHPLHLPTAFGKATIIFYHLNQATQSFAVQSQKQEQRSPTVKISGNRYSLYQLFVRDQASHLPVGFINHWHYFSLVGAEPTKVKKITCTVRRIQKIPHAHVTFGSLHVKALPVTPRGESLRRLTYSLTHCKYNNQETERGLEPIRTTGIKA